MSLSICFLEKGKREPADAYLSVTASKRRGKTAWMIWGVFFLVAAGTMAALTFGSDIWFGRPLNISGPYQLANLAVANGIHTLNALEVTPDIATWKKLDPNGQWEEIYNRYAFVSVNVVEQESADVFTLVAPDSFTVHVTPEQLRKLGVSNVLSPQKLDAMQFNGYSFERIGETIDGRTPYRIVQHQ